MLETEQSQGRLEFWQEGGVGVITIHRPRVKNAMTVAMWRQLLALAEQVRQDGALRVLVITGAGDEAFTTGSDIREFAAMSLEEAAQSFNEMEAAISAVETLPIPTIAALGGYTLGAGLELALACDLRIASERAILGMPIARLGIMISPKFAKRIVDLIGPARARDLLYTGRLVTAAEALQMGLVNYTVLSSELQQEALALARKIARQSARSVQAAKQAVALCLPFSAASGDAEPYFIDPVDFPEGVAAFLERRPPRFGPEEE